MLTGLRHRAVSSRNDENCTVHLCSAGDHVFNIVGVAGAVNVCIVTVLRLILNVSGVDCNTALALFRRFIDIRVINELRFALQAQNLGDCSGQSGFTVVNVADCADVNVRLVTFKFSFCHWNFSSFNLWLKYTTRYMSILTRLS